MLIKNNIAIFKIKYNFGQIKYFFILLNAKENEKIELILKAKNGKIGLL